MLVETLVFAVGQALKKAIQIVNCLFLKEFLLFSRKLKFSP